MNREVYISYVIQDEDKHAHHSEVIELKKPEYSYSKDNLSKNVVDWSKSVAIKQNEELVILNFFQL